LGDGYAAFSHIEKSFVLKELVSSVQNKSQFTNLVARNKAND